MRINFLIASPFPSYSGGIENWLYNMLRELCQTNIPVRVFALKSEDIPFYDIQTFTNIELIETIQFKRFNPQDSPLKRKLSIPLKFVSMAFDYLRFCIVTARLILKSSSNRDIYIGLHSVPATLPLSLAKLLGLKNKTICFMRGKIGEDIQHGNFVKSNFKKKVFYHTYMSFESITLKLADHVFSNGEDTASYVSSFFNLPSVVLPNGVNYNRFAAPVKAGDNEQLKKLERLRNDGHCIIMTVATLRDVKGIKFLIEAAALMKKKNLPSKVKVSFAFVGKGDPLPYTQYAEVLGVAADLVFTGEQQDVPSFVSSADILVAISGGGGVSNAAVEMMAAGKPVIAWDNLTYSQLITHGENGYLVHDRSSEALADGIYHLLSHSQESKILGKNAQEIARSYDWSMISKRFVEELQKTLASS